MRDAIADILGEFQPVIDPNTGELICLDWEYLVSAVVFIVCLWFVFCMIRTFLCGVMNRRW